MTVSQWDMYDDFMERISKPKEGYVDIPVEKIVDGVVVTVDTRSIPVTPSTKLEE